MQSKIISIRLPVTLRREAERLAKEGGVSLGEWIRRLVETATGVKADAKEGGFAHMSARKRKKAASAGGKARAAKSSTGG